MQVDKEEKVIVQDLKQDLGALLDVALIDELVDSQDSVDLTDAN